VKPPVPAKVLADPKTGVGCYVVVVVGVVVWWWWGGCVSEEERNG
jgi:hypothetical protein